MFFIAFVGCKQTIYGSITSPLKKLRKQNFYGLLFSLKRSSTRAVGFVNSIVTTSLPIRDNIITKATHAIILEKI